MMTPEQKMLYELLGGEADGALDKNERFSDDWWKNVYEEKNVITSMEILCYEDYSGGKLSEKKFTMMSAHYEQEQETNEEKLAELEKQYKAKTAAVTNAEQFTESLAQCVGMKELTASVLNTLIEKIEVHNPVMVNGVKEQKLTIYYKFVGQID